uniref:Fer1 n=1 Tax=Arundo donax TaxID=35708 RepID=A0A0A9GU08_ARUDO
MEGVWALRVFSGLVVVVEEEWNGSLRCMRSR